MEPQALMHIGAIRTTLDIKHGDAPVLVMGAGPSHMAAHAWHGEIVGLNPRAHGPRVDYACALDMPYWTLDYGWRGFVADKRPVSVALRRARAWPRGFVPDVLVLDLGPGVRLTPTIAIDGKRAQAVLVFGLLWALHITTGPVVVCGCDMTPLTPENYESASLLPAGVWPWSSIASKDREYTRFLPWILYALAHMRCRDRVFAHELLGGPLARELPRWS